MKDLTKGNQFFTILKFSLPLIIAGLISQSYNLVDLIIAGKEIGSDALSATGCTSTLIQFISSLFWGFGVAIATITGELFGARKFKDIAISIKTTLTFITVIMLVLTIVCICASTQILIWLRVDEEIFDSANNYFKIYMISIFIQAIAYQMTCIIQSLGNSKFPMLMTIVSGISNVILNLIFVLWFRWGIDGLAYATIISSAISLLFLTIKILSTFKELSDDAHFEFSFSHLKMISKLAIPCILQQCSLYIASVVVQPIINGNGKEVSAGFSIAMNVNLIFNAIYHSISRSVASYTSQCLGAKKYDRIGKSILFGIIQQMALVLPFVILTIIFPTQVFSIFLKDNDVSSLPYAIDYTKICMPFIFFLAFGNLMHSFYKSVFATKTVLLSTIIFTITRILLTYTIPNVDGRLFNVYFSLSMAWVVEALILGGWYFTGFWKSEGQKEYDKSKKNATISN